MNPEISHLTDLNISQNIENVMNIECGLQIIEVVIIAAIVPRGILRLGSRKSPLRFDPAMIPMKRRFWNEDESLFRTSNRWKIDPDKN